MTYLLTHHPIETWSFFFGLIIASAFLVSKEIKKWDIFTIISLVAGICAAYTITVLTPASTDVYKRQLIDSYRNIRKKSVGIQTLYGPCRHVSRYFNFRPDHKTRQLN